MTVYFRSCVPNFAEEPVIAVVVVVVVVIIIIIIIIHLSIRVHGVISQKTIIFIFAA